MAVPPADFLVSGQGGQGSARFSLAPASQSRQAVGCRTRRLPRAASPARSPAPLPRGTRRFSTAQAAGQRAAVLESLPDGQAASSARAPAAVFFRTGSARSRSLTLS